MVTYKDPGEDFPVPSNNDKEKIQRILLRYERKHPGYVLNGIQEVRREHFQQGGRKQRYGEVNKQSQGRILFELPEELGQQITDIAPFVFKSKRHLHWFIKHFPELLIPESY